MELVGKRRGLETLQENFTVRGAADALEGSNKRIQKAGKEIAIAELTKKADGETIQRITESCSELQGLHVAYFDQESRMLFRSVNVVEVGDSGGRVDTSTRWYLPPHRRLGRRCQPRVRMEAHLISDNHASWPKPGRTCAPAGRRLNDKHILRFAPQGFITPYFEKAGASHSVRPCIEKETKNKDSTALIGFRDDPLFSTLDHGA